MPLASCGDIQVCYDDTGGSGHPIILAHGFAMDRTMFAGQAALAPRRRVVAFDARGHGRTIGDGRPFTYWDLAQDLLRLMDALGIARATVGGVSQGGFVSLRAALLAPDRVHSLVLFDTEAGAVAAGDRVGYGQVFDALAERGPVPELLRPLAAQIVGDHPAAADVVRRWAVEGIPLGAAPECLLGRDDIIDRLGDIACPVLLVHGARDVSIPLERMAILEDRLANATPVHLIAGAGHSPPLTHPDRVNEIIDGFLSGLEDPATA